MNYLRYKKLYQSENDGTFWPGYIELPDEDDPSNIDTNQEEKSFYSSNPRIVTGVVLLILVAVMFLIKISSLLKLRVK